MILTWKSSGPCGSPNFCTTPLYRVVVHSKVIWRNWYALIQSLGTSNLSSCTILVLRIHTARFALYSYHLPRRFLPLFSSFSNFTTTLRPAVALPPRQTQQHVHLASVASCWYFLLTTSTSLLSHSTEKRDSSLCSQLFRNDHEWRHLSSVATPYDTAVTSRVATPLPPYSAPPQVTCHVIVQRTADLFVSCCHCWMLNRS